MSHENSHRPPGPEDPNEAPFDVEDLRPHVYDGIYEYDKRLPNWWLFTLYGAILFSVGYWAYFHWTEHMRPGWARVQSQMEAIKLAALAGGGEPTNRQLWDFSRDPKIVEAGHATYTANCMACHGADLKGGIGQDLTDAQWIHGGEPAQIYALIRDGVADKGMPTWGPVLGPKRIAEVAAFIISQNPHIAEPPLEPAIP